MELRDDNGLIKELTISRLLKAPIDLVWGIWTDEKHVREWWGPNGFTSPLCRWDAKAGNGIYIDMKGPDGTVVPARGEFVEVSKPTRLVFKTHKMGDDGRSEVTLLNTITLKEEGENTRFEMKVEVQLVIEVGKRSLKGLNVGLNQQLDKMERHLTSNNQ